MLKKLLLGILICFSMLAVVCHAAIIKPADGDTHPFVYLSDDFIAGLRDENGNVKPEYAVSYNRQRSIAKSALGDQPEGGYLSGNTSNRLVARALMYALGEYDDVETYGEGYAYKVARETVEYTLEYLKKPLTAQTYSINMYKDLGTNGIQCGALVYDWCNDVMTQEEKIQLANYIVELYQDTNGDGSPNYTQPARLNNISGWGDLAGKAVGQPLLYNAIAATALYDIRPQIYNDMMEKIQGTMASVVKAYGSAGAMSDGSISYTRDHYTYYVYMLLKRLGATDKQLNALYGDQQPLGYKLMYSRLPYGTYFKYGDNHPLTINRYTNGVETTDLGMLAAMHGNSYFRYQFLKENNYGYSLIKFLMQDCDVKPKLPDDLPLAYETKSPRTEVMARTSWQDGITSKTVVVDMNMNERRSGDHDHADIGSFQLYYKGPLTMPGGIYRGEEWGGTHWRNYYTRSIAANCMTVYMPGEVYKYGNRVAEANDGGQKMAGSKSGGYVIGDYYEHFSNDNIWAVTEGTYIGPNKNTPAFSYLKGDLTKAYSSEKMSSYKRGMVFMDTFNDTYPGILLVFDRVVSTDASYKKKWLLQAVTDPEVSGNITTITNTTDGANGKLVNTTLLPEGVDIEEVGGKAKYISDGIEWPAPEGVNFDTMPEAYASGYRVEVAPKVANKEDIFLNAMYVTDADGNAPHLTMIKENTNEFVGVTVLDRTVLFSKSGNFITNSFSVNIRDNNNGGDMLCLFTDIAPGKWKISCNGINYTIESVTGDNCLTAKLIPGTYTISPADTQATVTNISWPEAEKEKFGDFAVKLDDSYMYLPDETYLKDGIPYVSTDTIEQFGAKAEINGNTLTLRRWNNTSVITVGEYSYVHNDMVIKIDNPAIIHNGTIYVPVVDVRSAIGITANYVPEVLTLYCTSGTQVELENFLSPVSGTGVENLGYLCDGLVAEKINFTGNEYPYTNTPVTFYYGETLKKITDISVSGTNGLSDVRIYVSADGENFHSITSKGYSIDSGTFAYKVNEYAKYVRFIPSSTLYISELAVYGTDAEDICGFIADNIEKHNIYDELKTQVYIKNGFSSAELYIGDLKVYDFSPGESDIYNASIPSRDLKKFIEGDKALTLKVNYNGRQYESNKTITLVERKTGEMFIDEPINGKSYSYVFGNRGSYSFSRNAQNSTESYTGNEYKLTFSKQVLNSVPYVSLTGFQRDRGIYEINFKTEISSSFIDFGLELRDKNNKPIPSGATYSVISGVSGKFDVTIVADTENSILQVYLKETGKGGNKHLFREHKITTDSFGQFRFNISNRGNSGYITFDDINVVYKEVGERESFSESVSSDNKVLLSVSEKNAEDVTFIVNGNEVKKFETPSSNGVYEHKMSFNENGIKYFDALMKKDNALQIKSSSFVYDMPSKKGEAFFAGPFAPKKQEDGNYWINLTNTSTYFTGRVIFEGDIIVPSAEDKIYFELGGASDYEFKYGGENYITLKDAPGYGGVAMFNSNGKISDTDFDYKVGEAMHIKYVCDTYTNTYEIYIDDQLVIKKESVSQGGKTDNLADAKIVGCKVRAVYKDANEDGEGIPTISNVKTYQEITLPRIDSVYYDGVDALTSGGHIVPENAKKIEIKFSDAYTELDETVLEVVVDGMKLDCNFDYSTSSKTLTITDFNLKYGSILEVLVSPDALVSVDDAKAGKADTKALIGLRTAIFVGDKDRLCVLPVKSFGNSFAYAKYLNPSENSKECLFIAEEFSGDIARKLNNAKFKRVAINSATNDVLWCSLSDLNSQNNRRVMIWNLDLSPVFELFLAK